MVIPAKDHTYTNKDIIKKKYSKKYSSFNDDEHDGF